MSVISKNPFDLLNEDGDAPAPAPAPAKAAAPAPKQQRDIPGSKPPQNKNNDENKPSSGSGNRGRGGYYNRGAPRNVIRSDKDKPIPDSEITIVEPEQGFEGERRAPGKNERGQGRPRGHGEGSGRGRATRTRGRGSYGGAGGPALTGGERRHDGRRSAHALPDSEKKIASGWGADEGQAELTAEVEGAVDAVKEAAEPQTPAAAEDDGAGWGADVPADAAAPAEFAPTPAADSEEKKPVEEEDNTKSYDEYLAERAKAALGTGLGKLEGRQVEGTSEFTGSAFKRQDEDFFGGAKKGSAAEKAKKEKEKKEKVFIEVEGRFAPPSRGEGRGGRGGPRGGFRGGDRPPRGGAGGRGGRGGNRNASGAAANNGPAVSDESAFPALGA